MSAKRKIRKGQLNTKDTMRTKEEGFSDSLSKAR